MWIEKAFAVFALTAAAFASTPMEFGLADYRRALHERNLPPERNLILTELSMVLPHDGYSIMGNIVRGSKLQR